MKESLFTKVVLFFLFVFTSGCFGEDLPKMSGNRTYKAYKLPDNMTEIWPYDGKYLVYRDKKSGLEGIADLDGNVLLRPQCQYILDERQKLGRNCIYTQFPGLSCSPENISYIGYQIDLDSMKVTEEIETSWSGHGLGGHSMGYVYPDGTVEMVSVGFDWQEYVLVEDSQTGKYGTVNKKNELIAPAIYNDIDEYGDNLAIVYLCDDHYNNCKYGYIDRRGNLAIEVKYTDATRFDKGYATVKSVNTWVVIERDGSMPFSTSSWKDIVQINGRNFVAQAKDGTWYRLLLPVSSKSSKILQTGGTAYYTSQTSSSTSGNSRGTKVGTCSTPTLLKTGNHAKVINTQSLRIRKTPNGEPISQQAFPDRDIYITGGPKCVNNIVWYEINFLGYKGWVAEAVDGEYYLQKK